MKQIKELIILIIQIALSSLAAILIIPAFPYIIAKTLLEDAAEKAKAEALVIAASERAETMLKLATERAERKS